MKPKCIHIFKVASFALLLFSGCVTLETYIKDEETYSQKIPIEKKQNFLIFSERFVLNDYSLRYKGSTPPTFSFPLKIEFPSLYNKNVSSRRYVLYKNKLKLYTVDIIYSEKELRLFDESVYVKWDFNLVIIIHNKDMKETFKINFDKQQPYVIFNDNDIGEINFDYYKAGYKSRNYEYFTGFRISVNNEEYGILAFHPPSLYLKNNIEITDKMALYILSTYASYYYYGR